MDGRIRNLLLDLEHRFSLIRSGVWQAGASHAGRVQFERRIQLELAQHASHFDTYHNVITHLAQCSASLCTHTHRLPKQNRLVDKS